MCVSCSCFSSTLRSLNAPQRAQKSRSMDREIRARIGCSRLLLDRVAQEPTFASASRTQAVALVEVVRRAGSEADFDRAVLAELAQNVRWAPSDAVTVASAFEDTGNDTAPICNKRRMQLQDFQHIHDYFLEREWTSIRSPHATYALKLDTAIQRLIALSCRCPNEHTLKHVTAMLIVLSDDRAMTAQQKSEMMSHVKQQFRSASRRAGASSEHILQLPASFAELRRRYPQLAAAACSGEEPVVCPIDARLIHNVSQSFRCRGGGGNAVPMLHLAGGDGGRGGGDANSGQMVDQIQRFASFMMEGMTKMQENQSRLFASFSSPMSPTMQLANGSLAMSPMSPTMKSPMSPTMQSLAPLSAPIQSPLMQLAHGSLAHVNPQRTQALASGSLGAAGDDSPKVSNGAAGAAGDDSHSPKVSNGAAGDDSRVQVSNGTDGVCTLLNFMDQRDTESKENAKAKAKAKDRPKDMEKEDVQKTKAKARPKDMGKEDVQKNTPKKRCSHKQSVQQSTRANLKWQHAPDKIAAKHDVQQNTPEKISASANLKRPFVSLERSRGPHHLMCRTGTGGPGSTLKICFGLNQKYPSEKAARAAADSWVRGECKRRGIE